MYNGPLECRDKVYLKIVLVDLVVPLFILGLERCSGSNDVWTIGIQQGYSGSTDELE